MVECDGEDIEEMLHRRSVASTHITLEHFLSATMRARDLLNEEEIRKEIPCALGFIKVLSERSSYQSQTFGQACLLLSLSSLGSYKITRLWYAV